MKAIFLLLLIGFLSLRNVTAQTNYDKDILISFVDTLKDEYGYKNLRGDTIIPLGKYSICFTDTFKTYAIVAIPNGGFVAIDRQEKILFNVFPFDNGPDYVSDGFFRIVLDGKIGYADSPTGQIVIKPQFDCAWPFENGITKVSANGKAQSEGEYSNWLCEKWFYIDKTGKTIEPPKTD